MKVLLVSIDSLRSDYLHAYRDSPIGSSYDVETENLDAFADRAAVFETHFAGSLPCMPARREWMTGIQEFPWRPWGPVEPFDDPVPQVARTADALTQLVTDHFHYFRHGSSGYFEDYHGFEFVRGQEDDAWMTSPYEVDEDLMSQVDHVPTAASDADEDDGTDVLLPSNETLQEPADPHDLRSYRPRVQFVRNVSSFEDEEDFFAPRTFSKAARWLRDNRDWERWFLYLDSFEVHDPLYLPEPYASMYTDEDPRDPDLSVFPNHGYVDSGHSEMTDRQVEFYRSQYAGSVTMVDRWFGRLLDALDEEGLWDDTMVVVTSDHGRYLGEHGVIGAPLVPDYNIITKTPLLVWHPGSPRMGERIAATTSAVDLYATILDGLGAQVPPDTHSRSLLPLLMDETDDHRDWALYGWWGSSFNVTDGRFTYHHPVSADVPAYCHSTEMLRPWGWVLPPEPHADAEAGEFLPYTDTPVWRYAAQPNPRHDEPLLFDLETDPGQTTNLAADDPGLARDYRELLERALDDLSVPENVHESLGLEA